jgi:hypothetical protein
MIKMPKTIQIFLPSGDPHGIRIAELTMHICQVIEIPRSSLQEFLARPESTHVSLYFLFGTPDEVTQKVYIGQTGDLRARLQAHNRDREFWDKALVLISKNNSITQTHTQFLEWHCISESRKAGRYLDENETAGSRPNTPDPLKADCMDLFETGRILIATLGYPIFDPLNQADGNTNNGELYCKSSEANGSGIYTQEGFVVLKGSTGRIKVVSSMQGTAAERIRERLIKDGIIAVEGEKIVFQRDHLFKSPSAASGTLMGRSSNGWIDWKDNKGKTLREIKMAD